jgi:drug/metabolite transporter (DMT)-like permease
MEEQETTARRNHALGWLTVFGSAFFFYLATVIIRWARTDVDIEPAYFTFARFLLGFIVVCVSMAFAGHRPKPVRYHLLLGRTIANTVAVFCFYEAVKATTVAEANILNMTYPIFIVLLSWLLPFERRDLGAVPLVALAVTGIWMILAPGSEIGLRIENLWGLCSGSFAAAAMIYLNVSRRYHDSQTILFYMFGLGSLLILIFFHDAIFLPNAKELFYLTTCSVSGVVGQYLLTYGFRFVTAVEGSIISSFRIVLAALLGPILVADPHLTLFGWLGSLCIFMANVLLALRNRKNNNKK